MGFDTLKSTSLSTNVTFFSPLSINSPIEINIEAFHNAWRISPFDLRFFVASVAINLFIGNLFSCLVFQFSLKSRGLSSLNMMICVDQGFKAVGTTWSLLVMAASLSEIHNGSALVNFAGPLFCRISYFVGYVGVISHISCRTGIALIRYAQYSKSKGCC